MTVLVITAAAAALIGSILTAITGGVGIYANYKQNQENMSAQQAANQFNVASQERINNANIEQEWKMWNAQNTYNLPANQMQRYKDAGLSPHLIYGQLNNGATMSVPTQTAPQVNPVLSQMDFSGMQNVMEKLARLPFIKQQYQKLEQEAKNLQTEGESLYFDKEIKSAQWSKAKVESLLWDNLINDPDKFAEYYNEWSNSIIEQSKTAGINNSLKRTQTAVQDVVKLIKEVDLSHINNFWEAKLEAFRIKNAIGDIDLDFSELEHEIAAASGPVKWILMALKLFLK